MSSWPTKICALVLALALVPGAVEILENAAHLVTEGHLAHAEAAGDQHDPAGPEHGCTPVFHFCGCHASLAFLSAPPPPQVALHAAGSTSRPQADLQLAGFWPAIDRPPQV
ncbi:MAG: hypothetical protein AAF657_10090 [Acidobacteriota bacterium]